MNEFEGLNQKLPGLRDYLRAALLDGNETGHITMKADVFLNEVTELVFQWLLYDVLNGRRDLISHVKEYYDVEIPE